MKYFSFKRFKFYKVVKKFNTIRYNFLKNFNLIDIKRINFNKYYNYLNIKPYYLNFKRNYLNIKKFDYHNVLRKINIKINRKPFVYFFGFIVLFIFIYLALPSFYNYNKSNLENIVCNNQKIQCKINGKVKYSFYPTPRINIKELSIQDAPKDGGVLIIVEDASIKLSIKNLLKKEEQIFKKIKLNKFEININLEKYKNNRFQNINLLPIIFTKGNINLLSNKETVATISNANLNLKKSKVVLKGKFLNDEIKLILDSKKIDNTKSTNLEFEMKNLNLFTKIDFVNSGKDLIEGNVSIKKNKNKFMGIFNYKNKEITIIKSNLRNPFLDGKLEGKIKFVPYFYYDLDLILNSMNFTKFYNYFLTLEKNKIFKINNKINGNLSFSSEKVYSKYNLVKSFESRLKFNNGNILIEQFLINLGKLGAADIVGSINNNKKFSKFNFESNIFVDNKKKFLSKFGIYNKKKIPANLFISGNFDLENTRASFYEISDASKLNIEDINYIEDEFNDLMFEDGYTNLFNLPKFKEFLKLILSEKN